MPIREIVKSLLGLTPYRIVRRRALPRDHDAVLHNRAENINQMFSGRSLPRNYLSPGRRMLQEKTLQLLEEVSPPRPEGGAIGDFGCGTGDFLRLVSDRYVNYELCGYDFSEVSLALARESVASGHFSVQDLYIPPPRMHKITICCQTLEHLLEPELALRHLCEATLRPGVVLLTVPDGRQDSYEGHINFWSVESWTAWIARNTASRHIVGRIDRGIDGIGNLSAVIFIE